MKFRNPDSGNKISKKSLYLTIFIVVIMVSSVIGFVAFTGQDDGVKADLEYNGFSFIKANSGWITKINSRDIYFDYLPNEVKDINYDKSKLSIQSKVYIAYDPSKKENMDFILSKLDSNIKSLGYTTNLACVKEKNCPDVPVVDCESKDNILFLKIDNKNDIYRDKGCIIIEGIDTIELAKATDRFIYSITGVI